MSYELTEAVFSVLNLLVPGLVLAIFAAYYQTRKKNEILMETELAKIRIRSYEEIMAVVSRISTKESMSLSEEEKVRMILSVFNYGDMPGDFCTILSDEKTFDGFYSELKQLENANNIYFGYDVEKKVQDMLGLFSHMKLYLDAFSDLERGNTDKITMAYRISSSVMNNQIVLSYGGIEDILTEKITDIEIVPRKRYLKRIAYRMSYPFYRLADRYMYSRGWKGYVAYILLRLLLSKEYKLRMLHMQDLIHIMSYLHYSDRFTPEEYFTMPAEQHDRLYIDFRTQLLPHVHRG